ncbi:hypothetical protein PRZ48_006419 [Zasmidium cellare]|uniref:Dynactin subunit 6 n=1 Tax=Zasmidium cellare TaxID=395010 RepID=A0ABR0ENB6_ZASCE|nr:hypothetical protein PRZ48_006419 [Zasmidium cellare]
MTTRPAAPSSRPSDTTPRPPLKIHSLAIVADRAQITGTHPITIGPNTIIHPHARLRAEKAPITIGANCSISEKALISTSEGPQECVIGDGVDIQGDAVVEGARVGDWSLIEVGAKVERLSAVGRYCKVTALSVVLPGEVLGDFVVVFGEGGRRRVDGSLKGSEEMRGARERGQGMMLEVLGKLIVDGGVKWRGT